MSAEALAPREGLLAWTRASAAGELEGLGWVELALDPEAAPYREVPRPDGSTGFRQRVITRFLPPIYAESALEAEARGAASAIDGVHLVFARTEWTLAALEHLLGPLTPAPALLAMLVEPYGVPASLHEGEGDRLLRLVALLPRWYPWRGTLARGLEVLAACDRPAPRASPSPGPEAREVFVCRGEGWFRARGGPPGGLVIAGGMLRQASPSDASFLPEDVALVLEPGTPDGVVLARLLPAWTALRSFEEGPDGRLPTR